MGFELTTTFVKTPKSTNSVIAREETETNPGATDKQLNLKELRLAAGDPSAFFGFDEGPFFSVSRRSASFLRGRNLARRPYALHARSSSSTLFVSRKDIVDHLRSLENKLKTTGERQAPGAAATPAPPRRRQRHPRRRR
ncbi:hypothetical protein BKA70DRAFT_1571725 [Coprinopsis sp. MPI-PUGE-AT-0042]|nr:hypothetical protein BKA70DRAFT_1571725 [Coprinopsis sp. MPI-PUGE-AT-0042]